MIENKSIFISPLFINPLAYHVIPELNYLHLYKPYELFPSEYTFLIITKGHIEIKALKSKDKYIFHIDLYEDDGCCVLGEWYINNDSLSFKDNLIIPIINKNGFITIEFGESEEDKLKKYAYGVKWNVKVSDPHIERIGNLDLHRSLPIQSLYKGCIAKLDKVVYYLDPMDWSKKADGTPSVLDGTDGTVRVETPRFYGRSWEDGDDRSVMISTVKINDTWIEIPSLLIDAYRSTLDRTDSKNIKAVSVVNNNLLFRGGTNNPSYDKYLEDNPYRSHLNKAATNISRRNMRIYARNAGSEMLCYEYYKWIFYWAYTIEYANFNCLKAYKIDLTEDGFRQGGLGNGICSILEWSDLNGLTTIIPNGEGNKIGNYTGITTSVIKPFDKTRYSIWFSLWAVNTNAIVSKNDSNNSKLITSIKAVDNYAFYHNNTDVFKETTYIISGLTDGQKVLFKEKTGTGYSDATVIKEVSLDGEVVIPWSDYLVNSNRYVGFEITLDTCNIRIYNTNRPTKVVTISEQIKYTPRWRGFDNPFGDIWTNLDGVNVKRESENDNFSKVYSTTNPELYGDANDYILKTNYIGNYTLSSGNIGSINLQNTAEILPLTVAGNNNLWHCDNVYLNNSVGVLRWFLVGGNATHGSGVGLGASGSFSGVSAAGSGVGFRTINVKK